MISIPMISHANKKGALPLKETSVGSSFYFFKNIQVPKSFVVSALYFMLHSLQHPALFRFLLKIRVLLVVFAIISK